MTCKQKGFDGPPRRAASARRLGRDRTPQLGAVSLSAPPFHETGATSSVSAISATNMLSTIHRCARFVATVFAANVNDLKETP